LKHLGLLISQGPIEACLTPVRAASPHPHIPAHEAGIAQPLTIPDIATDAACGSDRAISGPSLIALWPVTLA